MATGQAPNILTDSLSAWIGAWKSEKDTDIQTRLIQAQGEQDRLTKLVELQYQNLGAPAPVRTNPPASQPDMAALPLWAKVGLGVAAVGVVAFMVSKLAH